MSAKNRLKRRCSRQNKKYRDSVRFGKCLGGFPFAIIHLSKHRPRRLLDFLDPEQIGNIPAVIPPVDPTSPYVIGYSGDPDGRLTPEEQVRTDRINGRAKLAFDKWMISRK